MNSASPPSDIPPSQISPPGAQKIRLGRHSDRRPLVALPAVQVAAASVAGVLLASLVSAPMVAWIGLFVVSLAILAVPKIAGSRFPVWALTVVFAMASWTAARQHEPAHTALEPLVPTEWAPVVLRGRVDSPIQQRPNAFARMPGGDNRPATQSVLEIQLTSVRDGTTWRDLPGRLAVTVQGDVSDLLIPDYVTVYGHWRRIAAPTNPGEEDLRPYYRGRQIFARLRVDSRAQFQKTRDGSWGPRRLLSWLSNHGDQTLRRYIGEDYGPLAAALVLGRRRAVDPQTRDQLITTGTAHLLSVSGLHLGIVAMLATWIVLLTPLGRPSQIFWILLICLFYAALTGARPPVLRAALLVAAVLIANGLGRQPSILNSLAIAAVLLMIANPELVFDTGVQLSFLAVLTLVTAGRGVIATARREIELESLEESTRSWLSRAMRATWDWLREGLRLSFWMWVMTAPLLWHSYHVIAPISVVANVLLIPLMTGSLVCGLCTTAIGLAFGPAAIPFGWACCGLLALQKTIISVCANLYGGHVWFPAPPIAWLLCFYGTIFTVALVRASFPTPTSHWRSLNRRIPPRILAASQRFARLRWLATPRHALFSWLALWSLAGCFLATRQATHERQTDDLAITFINVGHGTSVLIQLPDQRGQWLYDAGHLGDPQWASAPIEDTLWHYGIYRLEGLVLSHADADHYNAIPDLMRRFQIDSFHLPPGLLESPQRGLNPLRRAIHDRSITPEILNADTPLRDLHGAPWAQCLHPPNPPLQSSDNANSVVLTLEHAGTLVVLPGDLEMPGTELVLAHSRPQPGGVLMAPHHGSLTQDALPILQWARPAIVTVSGGPRANQTEVYRRLSQTGAQVHVTSQLGAIQIRITSDGNLHSYHWNVDHWQALEVAAN